MKKHLHNDHSYGPNTIYIHEKKVPYPYYMVQPHCEMNTDYRGHISPYIILPLTVLGSVLLFSIFTVGLLLIIERARLTPVIRARLQSLHSDSRFSSFEQLVTKAVEVYNKLNDY
ncbi:uncharacterized protein LOC125503932 isoform X2 [Dendroctonus ponderosae]|uniref:uncharacterized protein LOC125503932 isoform X2 n=1 Tax=Dendroctonus ponderosae TaxID=77166 RepID=UPI002035DCE4|nr:uncharacterized protein LOC125503932 isoform X2 [Dendroctonus ponderosae]